MFENSHFQQLVDAGHPTGEVIAVDRFIVTVKGLDSVGSNALVLFESGAHGMVREAGAESVMILNLDAENTQLGSLVVLQDNILTIGVGESLIGRVITPLCKPIDGQGPVQIEANWPIYNRAPGMMERSLLGEQLPTGVTAVDSLFPVVLGQRIAVLGDSKSGKSSFLLQLAMSQRSTDRIVVYVLIGKRRVDIDQAVSRLTETGAIKNSIVIVANIFDSLAQSYLAPYIGCAIAEFLWQRKNRDVVIVYDDLSAHAKVYREVALLLEANPGRDSYPGDMFFAHSSLLERAGKLATNNKTLTALPVVVTPADDITAYLPTSVMSITDGQIIFDLKTFRQNIKPAVNVGLSVSRVGGRAQSPRQKKITSTLFKKLTAYRQATEFAHFGSDLSADSQQTIRLGGQLYEAFRQDTHDLFTPIEQLLMLEVVLASNGRRALNIDMLKKQVKSLAASATNDAAIDNLIPQILDIVTVGAPE